MTPAGLCILHLFLQGTPRPLVRVDGVMAGLLAHRSPIFPAFPASCGRQWQLRSISLLTVAGAAAALNRVPFSSVGVTRRNHYARKTMRRTIGAQPPSPANDIRGVSGTVGKEGFVFQPQHASVFGDEAVAFLAVHCNGKAYRRAGELHQQEANRIETIMLLLRHERF